ncbi:hypothetical protein [Rugamonas rubra]|uniref:hypothetical protein n=1 Tax=Rugamonas rubra TaxID=758825 RepID=UPI001FE82992|nr:hypothetical protein [Rugamonas rubra]
MMKLRFSYVAGGFHQKLGQVFHWQQEAIGGENAQRYKQYLCEVLSSVAQGTDDCDRLLHDINEVENGGRVEIETGGNDVTLTLRPTGVQVDIEVNEDWVGQPDGHFDLREWKAALTGWRQFLQMPQSLESFVEVDL